MRITSFICMGMVSANLAAFGMATEQIGPDRDHPTVSQPEWPHGIVSLPRHMSRVYSIWVNGNENFYFQANVMQLNELLDLFSKVRMRDHEVWLKRGQPTVTSFRKEMIGYNANLQILSGIARAMQERDQSGDNLEPRLTLYLDHTLPIEQLVLPENLILHNDTPDLSIPNKAEKPARQRWYGRVQVGDKGTAANPQLGIRTYISLWEQGFKDEIKLTTVNNEGWFMVSFSDRERTALENGQSWLTITVGNWLTEPKPSDPRFPAENLGDKTTAKVIQIPIQKYYYGRIVFEDGSAPKLSPEPWPGAKIMVDFPYAGSAEPDDQGYFQVFFTPEQYEKVKADKPRKNIYIPDTLRPGQSTARFAFPASLLSQDRDQAGVVKITRP